MPTTQHHPHTNHYLSTRSRPRSHPAQSRQVSSKQPQSTTTEKTRYDVVGACAAIVPSRTVANKRSDTIHARPAVQALRTTIVLHNNEREFGHRKCTQ